MSAASLRAPAVACLIFLLFFGLYVRTAAPTIHVGDDGDMVTASWVLGVPHPSGYPLFVLLARAAASFWPLGNIAERVNLLSALFAAVSAAFLWLALLGWGAPVPAALFGAAALGVTASVWRQATVARVYALNLFWFVLLLWLSRPLTRGSSLRRVGLVGLLAALGMGNHLLAALAGGVAVVTVAGRSLWRRGSDGLPVPRLAAVLATGLLLGLSVYLLVPLRAAADPPIEWRDPENLESFLAVLLRADFWYKQEVQSAADLQDALAHLAGELRGELGLAVLVLGGLGLLLGRPHGLRLTALAWIVGNLALVLAHGSRYDLFQTNRYYMAAFAGAAILAAQGLHVVGRAARALRIAPRLVGIVFLAAVMLHLGVRLCTEYRVMDRSRSYYAYDYGHNLLRHVPQDATIIALGDNEIFPLVYLHFVERARPDVRLVAQSGEFLHGSEGLRNLRWKDPRRDREEARIIEGAPGEVFYTAFRPMTRIRGYAALPHGMLYRVQPDDRLPRRFDGWRRLQFRGIGEPMPTRDYLLDKLEETYREVPKRHRELTRLLEELERLAAEEQRRPHDPALPAQRADLLQRSGLTRAAQGVLRHALRRMPRSNELLVALGNLTARTSPIRGLLILRRATALRPDNPHAWAARAAAAERCGELLEARQAWERVLALGDSPRITEPARQALQRLRTLEVQPARDAGAVP
jgi:tetratricopeptide (TPR) repeat protein